MGNENNVSRANRRSVFIQEIDILIQKAIEDFDSVFQYVMTNGLKEINADYGHIVVKKNDELVIIYSNRENMVNEKMKMEESLCGSSFNSGKIGKIYNTKDTNEHYHILHSETRSEVALPIKDVRGVKTFGILNIEWKIENGPTIENIEFCEMLNRKIALAWQQNKLWQGVILISELSNSLLANIESTEVYNSLLKKILDLLDFDLGQILLVRGEELFIVASSNEKDVNVALGKNSICGDYILVQNGKEPENIPDIENSKYKDKYLELLGKGMRSEFVVPLVGKNNITIGAINIEDPRINAFSDFDRYVINIFGRLIANAIETSNERRKRQEMEKAKNIALVFASQSLFFFNFLHVVGNEMVDAQLRLVDFIKEIDTVEFNKILPNFIEYPDTISGIDFLKTALNSINSSVERISNIAERFDPNRIDQNFKNIELFEVISMVVETAKRKCHQPIHFNIIRDASLASLNVIDLQLSSTFYDVMDCLLDNAIEAMPDGGMITIELTLKGITFAEIRITDNGVGMDDETMSKIFDYGFTTKFGVLRKSGGGMGMGLWFVNFYLVHFGGEIKVKSNLAIGTTFYISVPLRQL